MHKICKIKGGVKLHKSRKHGFPSTTKVTTTEETYIDIESLVGCVAKAATKVVNEGLYPYEIRSELKSFSELVNIRFCILLHEKLNIKSSDPEKFYGFFYSKIVLNSKSLFPMLTESASKVLTTKLADILLCFKKEKEVDVTTSTHNISERELSGLHTLEL